MRATFPGKAAIVGIGATNFSKSSGRSELHLAVEAAKYALQDAGLKPSDIDGFVTYDSDTSPENDVARNLGVPEYRFFSRISHGGGAACGLVHQAAMAVTSGAADVVLCYRAFNERSGSRFGRGQQPDQRLVTADAVGRSWYPPYGLVTPASWVAMFATRYMHVSGATSADFGAVAVADRKHAATNPKAWFYEKPITIDDHQNSRWIVEPLHLLDCCQESDGGVAFIVTTAERAKDLGGTPVIIEAAAQGASYDQESMTSYYRATDDLATLPEMNVVGRQLWEQSGLTPKDIQTAILYDHFTPFTLIQLEDLGFCERGEAKNFVKNGNIELGGGLPLNPHGGQLGEAYIHGVNGILEAVRQVRGTAANPVPNVEHVLVTAGTGVPTSGTILGPVRD